MYTIAEFRANLREAFNDAEHGKEVIIERYGQRFFLIPDETFVQNPKQIVEAKQPPHCPNGHSIPNGFSKCLGKGCKYS